MTARSPDVEAPLLVVDDDDAVRALLATGLRRAGFDVLEAASGEAALGVVESEAIGLVVLDIGLPGISGTDVVRALRARPQTATLPVILLTGSGDEYSLVEGPGAGADDYLTKPVRLEKELPASKRSDDSRPVISITDPFGAAFEDESTMRHEPSGHSGMADISFTGSSPREQAVGA